ncbi:MAG: DNA-binding protein [Planctomycetia bacterium]|nr:DNA-binding protein [Planctomycetia bacterium]
MNRADLQTLANVRLVEAQLLLGATPPQPDGAYYLAGYAIECALKAAIAKLNNQHDWPEKAFVADCHTHDILKLVRLAGLEAARVADSAANPLLSQNWVIVKDWSEHSRYERHSYVKARKMLDAVADHTNGVLSWIKGRW